MKPAVWAMVLASWAGVMACAAGQKAAMAPAASPDGGARTPMPGDPRNEIDRLAQEIDASLATAGAATLAPATCEAEHTCTAEPMGVPPRVEDPACRPGAGDVCTQACTLSDSVCKNADRICELAAQLGRADDWANAKCQSANDACKRTRERCCGCS